MLASDLPAAVLSAGGRVAPAPRVLVADLGGGAVAAYAGAAACGSGPCTVAVELVCCPVDLQGRYAGPGVLSGATTVTAVAGVATFPDLSISAVGSYTFRFSARLVPGIMPALSMDVPGASVQNEASLELAAAPSGAMVAEPLREQPVVHVLDDSGVVTNASVLTVNVSIASGGCDNVTGTLAVTAVRGVARFTDLAVQSLAAGGASSCTLLFRAGAFAVTAPSFSVSFGPPVFAVEHQPAATAAGVPLAAQPRVRFAFGADGGGAPFRGDSGRAVSATLLQADAPGDGPCGNTTCGSLLRGTTVVLNSEGVAAFTDLQIDRAAAGYRLHFSLGHYGVTSAPFGVAEGPVAAARVLVQPTHAQVGLNVAPAVAAEALDLGGNRVTGFTGGVTAALFPAGAFGFSLAGGAATAAAGAVEFAALQVSGHALKLRLTLDFGGGVSVETASFNVYSAPAALLLRSPMQDPARPAEPFARIVQVAVVDKSLVLIASDSASNLTLDAVHVASGDETRLRTDVTAVGGIASFKDISLTRAGLTRLRFSLAADPLIAATSAAFEVLPGAPASLAVLVQPADAAVGDRLYPPPAVTAQDAWGNAVAAWSEGGGVRVCLAQLGAPGACEADGGAPEARGTTTAAIAGGAAAFADLAVFAPPAAARTLLFSAGGGVTVGSAAFALALGGPRFTVTTHPGGAAAGAPFAQQPVVAVTDPAGNAIATGAGVVRYVRVTAALATSFVPAAVLSDAHGACPCAVRLRDGVAAFTSLALSHPGGGFVIEFTTEAVRFAAGPTRSAPFAVTGPAVYATVDGAPARVEYLAPFALAVTLRDANRRLVAAERVTLAAVHAGNLSEVAALAPLPPDPLDPDAPAPPRSSLAAAAPGGTAHFAGLQALPAGPRLPPRDGYALRFRARVAPSGAAPGAPEIEAFSEVVRVVRRAPARMEVSGAPPAALAREALRPAPKVSFVDALGNPADFDGAVAVAVRGSAGGERALPPLMAAGGEALADALLLDDVDPAAVTLQTTPPPPAPPTRPSAGSLTRALRRAGASVRRVGGRIGGDSLRGLSAAGRGPGAPRGPAHRRGAGPGAGRRTARDAAHGLGARRGGECTHSVRPPSGGERRGRHCAALGCAGRLGGSGRRALYRPGHRRRGRPRAALRDAGGVRRVRACPAARGVRARGCHGVHPVPQRRGGGRRAAVRDHAARDALRRRGARRARCAHARVRRHRSRSGHARGHAHGAGAERGRALYRPGRRRAQHRLHRHVQRARGPSRAQQHPHGARRSYPSLLKRKRVYACKRFPNSKQIPKIPGKNALNNLVQTGYQKPSLVPKT